MQFRQKLLFDRLLGTPLGFLCNVLAWLLGKLLQRDHRLADLNGKTVVVFKLMGLGSILEFTPALQALKKRYPQCRIVFVSSKANAALLRLYPNLIDEVLLIGDSKLFSLFATTARVLWRLIGMRADTFINLEVYSRFASIFAACTLARNRMAFYRKSTTFRKSLDTHLIFFNTQKNIREIYALPVRLLTGEDFPLHSFPQPQLTPQASSQVEAYLQQEHIGAFVLINPNASELMPERKWVAAYWVVVIQALVRQGGFNVLLSGSASERPGVMQSLFDELPPDVQPKVRVVAGVLPLEAFWVLLGRSRVLLTVDSGPYHMAVAMQHPVISLWGPGDPAHYAIDYPQALLLKHAVYCAPCLYHADIPPCAGDNYCMKSIMPQELLHAAGQLLQINFLPEPCAMAPTAYVPGTVVR